MMSNPPKTDKKKTTTDEGRDAATADETPKSYYYDDSHGYENYVRTENDEDQPGSSVKKTSHTEVAEGRHGVHGEDRDDADTAKSKTLRRSLLRPLVGFKDALSEADGFRCDFD